MTDAPQTIAQRLQEVRGRLSDACHVAGRDPAGVTLVAVSKGQPAQAIRDAYAAGQRDFGENYVQEWQVKAQALADLTDLRWHFVGHLQRNKVKLVVGNVFLLHSADDMAGIGELARVAWSRGVRQDVLLQVNLAQEASKRGCTEAEADEFVQVLCRSPGLRLLGLMTLPPVEDDPQQARPWFAQLRGLRDRLAAQWQDQPGVPVEWSLSMGMSGDFSAAIAEGATHVRIGTAIFGSRTYT
jgi:pyridoxal phosphate enzyme (YggS family)